MEEQTSQTNAEKSTPQSSYEIYCNQFAGFALQLSESYKRQIGENNPDELEVLSIFCDTFTTAAVSVKKEMMIVYKELDTDTTNLLNRHIENFGILKMQSSAIEICKSNKKKKKLELILEIIKKAGLQIIELIQEVFNLPNWLEKILKIIVGLFEALDNILPEILELMDINPFFLKQAERDLLEFHPKWKELRTTIKLKNTN